ncbi:MAG: YqeG family HAD IIIA-type phosphatase [Halanaerobiales bacterium]
MLGNFFPDIAVDSIFDIDYKGLYEEGKRYILFDIDNTLVPYNIVHPNNNIIELFKKIKDMGFKIGLVSNNNEERVLRFNEKLKLVAIHKARKPFTRNLIRAISLLGATNDETVLVGDQVFTDVFGGNRLGIKTVLVVPLSEKEEWITKIKRGTEKKILKIYKKRIKRDGKND